MPSPSTGQDPAIHLAAYSPSRTTDFPELNTRIIAKALTGADNCFFELARVLFFGSGFADGGLEETLYGMCADWLDTVPP